MNLNSLGHNHKAMATNQASPINTTQSSALEGAGIKLLSNSIALPSTTATPPSVSPVTDEVVTTSKMLSWFKDYAHSPEITPSPSVDSRTADTTTADTSTVDAMMDRGSRAERRARRTPASLFVPQPALKNPALNNPALAIPSSSLSPAPNQAVEPILTAEMPPLAADNHREQLDDDMPLPAEQHNNRVHKRVKRFINGDAIFKGSPLVRSVGVVRVPAKERRCTAGLVGANQFMMAAHCVTNDKTKCETPTKLLPAFVSLRGRDYKCVKYSVPGSCFKLRTGDDPGVQSNETGGDEGYTDVVICHTHRPVKGGRPFPLMNSADYDAMLNKQVFDDVEVKPSVMIAGQGFTGADCQKPPTGAARLGWGRYKQLSGKELAIELMPGYQMNRNYTTCPGDSGAPVVMLNPKTNTYEMIGVHTSKSKTKTELADSFTVEVVSEKRKTWLSDNGIKPWTENPKPDLPYYNLTEDAQVRIPLKPVKNKIVDVPDSTRTTTEPLKQSNETLLNCLNVTLQNHVEFDWANSADRHVYCEQPLYYFDQDNTFNISDVVREKVAFRNEFNWLHYRHMRLEEMKLATSRYACTFQWNRTTLARLTDNPDADLRPYLSNSTMLKGPLYNVNVTVNGTYGSDNFTVTTMPENLLIQDDANCRAEKFETDGHFYYSAGEATASSWPAVIALTTAVSFLLKDG